MKKAKRIMLCILAVIVITAVHYWATITAACVLQAAATVLARLERGYYAMGSEIMVFPIVMLIGYKITPEAYITITEKGVRYHVRRKRVSGNQGKACGSGNGVDRSRVQRTACLCQTESGMCRKG